MKAIIKVNEPNYCPAHVKIRSQISPLIFTAEFEIEYLDAIKSDNKVIDVSIEYNIPLIK